MRLRRFEGRSGKALANSQNGSHEPVFRLPGRSAYSPSLFPGDLQSEECVTIISIAASRLSHFGTKKMFIFIPACLIETCASCRMVSIVQNTLQTVPLNRST